MVEDHMLQNFEKMFGEGAVAVATELVALQNTLSPEQSKVIDRFVDMITTGLEMTFKTNEEMLLELTEMKRQAFALKLALIPFAETWRMYSEYPTRLKVPFRDYLGHGEFPGEPQFKSAWEAIQPSAIER